MPPGRPKQSDVILQLELRITPPDQQPIVDWLLEDHVTKFLACEEGGPDTDKQLHYHCIIETPRTRNWLIEWIYRVARCKESGERGNAVFFTRKPHDHTMGYIVKCKKIVCRHGYDQPLITEFLNRSDEYRKEKERNRKKKTRERQEMIAEIMSAVQKHLEQTPRDRAVKQIAQLILSEFRLRNALLPPRGSLEQMTLTLLYPYNPDHVLFVYSKFISEI